MTSPTWNISIKDGRPVARQTIRGLDPQKLADDLETAYKAKATNLVEKVNEYKDKKIPAVTTLKTKTDAIEPNSVAGIKESKEIAEIIFPPLL